VIARTFDYRLIKRLAGEVPCVSNEIIYLVDGGYLWYLSSFRDGLVLHRSYKTPCKGKEGKRSGLEVFKWVFENTKYDRIYGQIEKDDKPARYMASYAGMEIDSADEQYIYYVVKK